MRIALFTESYAPVINGAASAVRWLADALASEHEVVVYAPRYPGYRDPGEGSNCDLILDGGLGTAALACLPVSPLSRFSERKSSLRSGPGQPARPGAAALSSPWRSFSPKSCEAYLAARRSFGSTGPSGAGDHPLETCDG